MLENNLWNRLFNKSALKKQNKQFETAKKLVGFGPETLQYVELAKNLKDLLDAHKLAWSRGYKNKNLAPCSYGMFRTKSITTMKPEEVFLGNIYGIWTFNIPYWESHKHIDMSGNSFGISEDTKCYDIIMRQYRTILRTNINNLIKESKDFINEVQSMR